MITVQGLNKQYGAQVLFKDASFTIAPGERVGLLGRNGHGKSTLLRLLTGEEGYDQGTVTLPRDYRIGHQAQHIEVSMPTVLKEGCLGLPAGREEESWRIKKTLAGLGIGEDDLLRDPAELSGGFQMRLSLAKVLVSEPNLLLLDEPTNFLDIVSIRWLERLLKGWRGELIVISHDRSFMDSVTTHVMGIHRTRIRKLAGSTEKYYAQIAQEEVVHEKQRVNLSKKRKQAEVFISRFRSQARHAGLVQSRIKALEKQEPIDKLAEIEKLSFSFNAAECPARYVLEARGISFSYAPADPLLVSELDLGIEAGDRIGVIGKNGRGKTTLLKLLAGVLDPTEGLVRYHPNAQVAYFEQSNTAQLDPNNAVLQEVIAANRQAGAQAARNVCGAMMFPGDHVQKKISVLSGGEKCRVLLGKLLLTPANLLLFDEPTHHLDADSCEALMEAFADFPGGVVVVTHNERILRRIADRLVVFQGDRPFLFPGTYDTFLDRIGWDEDEGIRASSRSSLSKKELKKARAEFVQERSKAIRPLEKAASKLEKSIEMWEIQLHNENQAMIVASNAQDVAGITRLSKSTHALREQIDAGYEELQNLTEQLDAKQADFEAREQDAPWN
ncbi:ABC-F family ATP-binding cassette domain-containing protein [Planctomycetota bacterium]